MTGHSYPAGFYAHRPEQTRYAAERVLSVLPPTLPRRRVADIGCGTGTWLAAALASGGRTAHGFEGSWVSEAMLDDPRIELTVQDLEQRVVGPRFDLALSLEVAEHLSPGRAPGFVADLVALAPAVLFGAAIPGQGGVNHINEQWPSYWAGIFAGHGYRPFDVVRPAIWTDPGIPPWYRQNTILYLDAELAERTGLQPVPAPGLLDAVHPWFWGRANRELEYAGALPESVWLARSRG